MQEFTFPKKYDLIWSQWVIGHLTDSDLVSFLRNCGDNLTPTGCVVIKDNVCSKGFCVDKTDYSIARDNVHFLKIFSKAGMRVVLQENFENFPQECFRVTKYALKKAI